MYVALCMLEPNVKIMKCLLTMYFDTSFHPSKIPSQYMVIQLKNLGVPCGLVIFEYTVYTCCMRLVKVVRSFRSPSLHKVPLQYLEDVLTEIKTGLGEMFCVTRRSAGMPFIIQVSFNKVLIINNFNKNYY